MKELKLLLALLLIFCLFTYCSDQPEATETVQEEPREPTQEDLVKRGEYLVSVMGCHDCHSPKQMGSHGPELIPDLMLSGYPGDRPFSKADVANIPAGWALFAPDLTAAVGPWGASFAANITSDETGIGTWSQEQFNKAFRQGKSKGMDNTRPLLPPMPWENFSKTSDEDVRAIFAYLKSTKPVKNMVPAPISPDQLQ